MQKIKSTLILFIGLTMLFTFTSTEANAEWKSNDKGYWYTENNSYSVGWKEIEGKWYFFDESGYMMTGWVESNNKWYYLNNDGIMMRDTTVQGYKLGNDGSIVNESLETKNKNSESKMVKGNFKGSDNTDMGYWLYSPKNADNNKKLPLVIYLHGYWGEDTDTDLVIKNDGLPKFLYDKTLEVPAYVLCPHAKGAGWNSYLIALKEYIDKLVAENIVDPDRISITGHSMGGFGTWTAAIVYPDLFSCIVPVSGYMESEWIPETNLKDIPVWAFVGDKDETVNPQYAIDSVNKLKELGGNAKLTVYEGAAHNDTANLTYLDKDSDVLNWMISQSRQKK